MKYKILDHPTDLRLLVQGKTYQELFTAGLKGMTEILAPHLETPVKKSQRTITLKSPDITALLIDFLNEVLFLAQTYKEVYQEVNFQKLTENSLIAKVWGRSIKEFKGDIKAITYHEAQIKKNLQGNWETVLVLDI